MDDSSENGVQAYAPWLGTGAAGSSPSVGEPEARSDLRPQGTLGLRILSGIAAGNWVPLGDTALTLGREMTNTLPLGDGRVSRYHARIDPIEDAWVLSELGSTNGTRLNGLRVQRAGLAPGDRIYVGDTVIAVEAEKR